MAVSRFSGSHVGRIGSPRVFRTSFGAHMPMGMPGFKVESLFSRKGETANLDAVRAQQSEAVAQFNSMENSSVHITNNTAHIERLNEGWSAQTSAGFFERALYEAKKAVLGHWKFVSTP